MQLNSIFKNHILEGVIAPYTLYWFTALLLGSFVSPFFIIFSFIFFYFYQAKLNQSIEELVPNDSPHYFWWMFLLVFIMMLVVAPFPKDDLLRNVVGYAFHYDYHNVFPDTENPLPINLWIGFEFVLGKLTQLIGDAEHVVSLVQATSIFVLLFTVALAILKCTKHHSHPYILGAVLFLWLLYSGSLHRALNGRPEVFFTAIMFSAVFLNLRWWLIVGTVSSPLYWLSPLYSLGGLLVAGSVKNRIMVCVLAGIFFSLFWMVTSPSAWFESIQIVNLWKEIRLVKVSELSSVTVKILEPSHLIPLLLGFYFLSKKTVSEILEDPITVGLLSIIVFFTLLNMQRYHAVINIASILLVALHTPPISTKIQPAVVLVFSVILTLWGIRGGVSSPSSEKVTFDIPEGATVFSSSLFVSQSIILQYKGAVKVVPGYDTGLYNQTLQQMMASIASDTITCDEIISTGYQFIVENSFTTIRPCLTLKEINKKWRMWEVDYSKDKL